LLEVAKRLSNLSLEAAVSPTVVTEHSKAATGEHVKSGH
jgi:hypothetical protein